MTAHATRWKMLFTRVEPDTTIMSDEFTSYNQLHLAFNHFTCNHSEGGQYSVNLAGLQIHTNKIEGVWSHLKTKAGNDCLEDGWIDLSITAFFFQAP